MNDPMRRHEHDGAVHAHDHDHPRDHDHPHDHDHSHGHDPHHVDPRAAAALDIGGDIGALLVSTAPELAGVEIEVLPVDGPQLRTHTQVHRREVGSSVSTSGLFPALTAGRYRLLSAKGAAPAAADPVLTVVGGEVTTYRLVVEPAAVRSA